MACGGNKIKVVAVQKPVITFGEKGLLLVRYNGWLDEYTVKTNIAKYRFTKDKREQYVDARDREHFVNEIYDGVRMFDA